MDLDGRLTLLLRECAWATEPSTILRSMPELAQDCPPITEVPLGDGSSTLAIPFAFHRDIATPLAGLLQRLLVDALERKPREVVNLAGEAEVRKDPLASVLWRLVDQTRMPGLQAANIPALGVARVTADLLAGEEVGFEAPTVSKKLRGALKELVISFEQQPAARQAEVLSDVAWGIGARITAAYTAALGNRGSIPALTRRIAADPLALCVSKKRGRPELSVVAALAALPVQPKLLVHIEQIAEIALANAAERWGKGKAAQAADVIRIALRQQTLASLSSLQVLLHPTAGPLLIASLPDLVDGKSLDKAGVAKDVASSVSQRDSAMALASVWADLAESVVVWDALSTLASQLQPLEPNEQGLAGPKGPLPLTSRWALLVPRSPTAPTNAAVVAVRLTELTEHLRQLEPPGASVPLVERAWRHVVRTRSGALASVMADHGIAVFTDCLEALEFVAAFRGALALSGLDTGTGAPIQLPDGVQVSVGIAWGAVRGGTDGRAVHVDGSAVARAISLCGVMSPDHEHPQRDPLGMSNVVVTNRGLVSHGIVCDGWVVNKSLESVRQRDLPLHMRGTNANVAGAAQDFVSVPLSAWWLYGERVSCLLPLDGEDSAGPCEYIDCSPAQFRRFCSQDQNQGAAMDEPEPPERPNATAGASVSVSIPRKGTTRVDVEEVDDPWSEPPIHVVTAPDVTFGLDVPEAAKEEVGDTADLWGHEDGDVVVPASVGASPPRPITMDAGPSDEPTDDPHSIGDIVSYDGPVVSIEDTDDPASVEVSLDLEPLPELGEWEDEVPTDGSGKAIPDPLPEPGGDDGEVGPFGGSSMTVRPVNRRDFGDGEVWDDAQTDPNIRIRALQSEEPVDITSQDLEVLQELEEIPAPTRPSAPLAAAYGNRQGVSADVGHALVGYVLMEQDSGFVFGRRYGGRLVDVHRYEETELEAAYAAFLKDKIDEGFVPRMELTTSPPDDAELREVDVQLLNQQYRDMVSQ